MTAWQLDEQPTIVCQPGSGYVNLYDGADIHSINVNVRSLFALLHVFDGPAYAYQDDYHKTRWYGNPETGLLVRSDTRLQVRIGKSLALARLRLFLNSADDD